MRSRCVRGATRGALVKTSHSATWTWLPLQVSCSRVGKLGCPWTLSLFQAEKQEGDDTPRQGWRGAGLGRRKVEQ